MAYLTCTKHRSFQRKHIDVCRQCPDNQACDDFQAYAAENPPPPPPVEPAQNDIPIRRLLAELGDIRRLVADRPAPEEAVRVQRRKKPLQGIELMAFIRSELEGIRKLC